MRIGLILTTKPGKIPRKDLFSPWPAGKKQVELNRSAGDGVTVYLMAQLNWHRMMLMTAYSAGLRVSELVNLQVRDIHSDRMLIHVRSGKGDKDRFTLLSARLLAELRDYWLWCRPKTWLFLNRNGLQMAADSAQQVFYKAKQKAGIKTGHGIHSLRHSFATHLLESGVDMTLIIGGCWRVK